jgi:pimeloyl-ACP methyl ester carboxylesterase
VAVYVLIHGGRMSTESWNRLSHRDDYPPGGHLGGKVWDPVRLILEAHSHVVFSPDLLDEHSSGLADHIEQVRVLLTENAIGQAILVGHSYGGMVITGVAAILPERVRRLVYVDAALPEPGQSLFDVIAAGGCDPMSFPGLDPAKAYVEKLNFAPLRLSSLPKTYILCTQSEFSIVTSVARRAIMADPRGWSYDELPSSHVPMASMPDQLGRLLLEAQ